MQKVNNVQIHVSSDRMQKHKWTVALAINFRSRRMAFFKSLIELLPRPLHVLDVGGLQEFWQIMGFIEDDIKFTLLNTEAVKLPLPNVTSVVGDARDMHEFKDKEFEVVFSNSVIEHVGSFEQQCAMAQEIQRIAKRYIIQTPNRYFPIEPHTLFPFFQFLPLRLKMFIATHTPAWGWKSSHIEELSTIRLMTEKELRRIFPGACVYKEKFLGLTKSLTLYSGW